MALQKAVDTQRDFSAGEIDAAAKRRDDDEFVKKGMRQLSNARVLNTGGVTQRPGRNLLQKFANSGRAEDVTMAPGVKYRLAFTNNLLTIYDSSGTSVLTQGANWTSAQVDQIRYAVYLNQIFITFGTIVPLVLTWNGVSSWSVATYAELVIGNQKRTPFYRIAAKGISIQPIAASGAGVQCNADQGYFVSGMIGTRIRFINRQMLITGVTNANQATVTIEEPVPGSQDLDFGAFNPSTLFSPGDLVEGQTSRAKGIVAGFSGNHMTVQLTTLSSTQVSSPFGDLTQAFTGTETVVNSAGSHAIVGASSIGGPLLCTIWDEEVMNSFRGYPRSVAVDQGRLIFSDFPAVPGGIAWSAIGSPTDLYIGPNPSDAMFELAPGKVRVQDVVAGPEGAEFVFGDAAVFYIAISPSNPLRPGSVAFQKISSDGAATVQPRSVGGVILYADQGLTQVQSIVTTGSLTRPYESMPLTDLHSHLFNGIRAIALPTSVTQFPERYVYVLNGDGTMAIGKYALDERGNLSGRIGWLPWTGNGAVQWVSALNDAVLFLTAYTSGATAFMLEQLDATLYLDGSLPVNAIPSTLTPPGGKGPLWWLPGVTVDLMDGRLPLGPHTTDANGFIVPITPGEDLSSATLRAGFTWTGIWEPFVLTSQGSQGADERMKKRRISRLQIYVMNSSGFMFAKFYSGKIGPNLPALGTIVGERRVAAYNVDDDANLPPPLREFSDAYKPLGRSHDPRAGIIKDTPGPLTLVEMAAKASI